MGVVLDRSMKVAAGSSRLASSEAESLTKAIFLVSEDRPYSCLIRRQSANSQGRGQRRGYRAALSGMQIVRLPPASSFAAGEIFLPRALLQWRKRSPFDPANKHMRDERHCAGG